MTRTADFYNKVYQLGIPMVGVDPAMTLCYRDEYRKILGDSRGDFVVQMTQEWLLDNLDALKKAEGADGIHEYYLMAHGEIQASIWPEDMRAECQKLGMHLI